jgi:hypothetical protein
MIWEKHAIRLGEMRIVYKILIGKLAGKRPLGRTRRRSEGKKEDGS